MWHVHAIGVERWAISDDNTQALVVYRLKDQEHPLGLTVDVAAVGALLTTAQKLRNEAQRRKVGAGNVVFQAPRTYAVGNSPERRGRTFVQFDEQSPDEIILDLADADALNLAQAIERDVLSRMTQADRVKYLAGKRAIVPPKAHRIILPGGFQP